MAITKPITKPDPKPGPLLYWAVCRLCEIRSSPFPTTEQADRALLEHFEAEHPDQVDWLRTVLVNGQLPTVRRRAVWEPIDPIEDLP